MRYCIYCGEKFEKHPDMKNQRLCPACFRTHQPMKYAHYWPKNPSGL